MDFRASRFYLFDSFCLDPAERRLFRGEEQIPLAHANFDVLMILVQRAGEDVTKEELWKVWGNGKGNDALLNTAIYKVREALGDDAKKPRYIVTVPNKGYRFLVKVELRDSRPLKQGSQSPVTEPSRRNDGNDQQRINGSPAIKSGETWGKWLTGGIWRDFREGADLIKGGFDTLGESAVEAGSVFLTGGANGASNLLRGFRKCGLPLAFVVALVFFVLWWWRTFLKNHPRVWQSLLLFAIVLLAVEFVRRWKRKPAIRKVRSIAVLAFKNQNCPEARRDFAQGLTNAVISKLTQLEFLRIRQANYSGSETMLGIIKRLRMGAVLTGTIDWSNDQLCVTAMLFKWDGKTILWGEPFEERFTSNFTTQNAISQQLVDRLSSSLREKTGKE